MAQLVVINQLKPHEAASPDDPMTWERGDVVEVEEDSHVFPAHYIGARTIIVNAPGPAADYKYLVEPGIDQVSFPRSVRRDFQRIWKTLDDGLGRVEYARRRARRLNLDNNPPTVVINPPEKT